jgi:prevent-host-death family protein
MTVLPVAEAQAQLMQIVESAVAAHERTTITRGGIPVAVLLSFDDFEGMRETIAVLAETELMDGIRDGLANLAAGRVGEGGGSSRPACVEG